MQDISIAFPKAQGSFVPQRGLMTREQRQAVDLLGMNWIVQRNLPLSVTSSSEFHDYMLLASNGAYQGASRETNYGVLMTMAQRFVLLQYFPGIMEVNCHQTVQVHICQGMV